jgi:hypothetical protein
MKRIERNRGHGEAGPVLVHCMPECTRHHCESCGVAVGEAGDPRFCTSEPTGNFC